MEEEHWLTVDQLLTLADAAGVQPPEITARKIERWRKARLLPRPRRISLGRKGTRSEYPPETGLQLLALCRLRRKFPHDLDAIRFGLWYEGYRIPINSAAYDLCSGSRKSSRRTPGIFPATSRVDTSGLGM